MAVLPLAEFIKSPGATLDVRSPGEYLQGHLPGALNLPLFSNAERAAVGTIYKQQGQKAAIALGLEITGPKLASFVAQASAYCPDGQAKVYCWRGGMRSGAMAWLLGFAGLKTVTLQKGYKTFRHWVLQELERQRNFIVLGGMTGSGKTAVLEALKCRNEQVLNLEFLANHRGSTYGKMGLSFSQPTTEHLENRIATQLSSMSTQRPIWVEDESRMIGRCHLPNGLFQQMSLAPLIVLDVDKSERIQHLKADYGSIPKQELAAATEKIGSKLGSQRKNAALNAIEQNDLDEAIGIVLEYYDKSYLYSLTKRQQPLKRIEGSGLSAEAIADRLLHDH